MEDRRASNRTTEDVTTRSNDAPSLLEKVTKLVEKKDPSRVLTELVDANGQSGHAVFIDCANQVIIDPANPRVVPFSIHELDRCTGPYTMCVGLKHPKFVDFAPTAAVLSKSLADAANAAANELGALSEGEFDARLENHNAAEDEREFQDFGADHADDMDEERRLYPGPLRRLSRPTAEEREAPMVAITQAHSNPVAGVENVRMTLRNRLGRT